MTHSVNGPSDDFVLLSSKELPSQGELEAQERNQKVSNLGKFLVPFMTAVAVKVWGSTPITVGTYLATSAAAEAYRRYVI